MQKSLKNLVDDIGAHSKIKLISSPISVVLTEAQSNHRLYLFVDKKGLCFQFYKNINSCVNKLSKSNCWQFLVSKELVLFSCDNFGDL